MTNLLDPDLPLEESVDDLGTGDVVVFRVTAVGVQAILDNLDFLFCQEGVARFMDLVGEIDNDEVAENGEGDGDKTLDNEDPSPSAVSTGAIEFVDGVREEVSETTSEQVNGVEDGDALLDLVSLIPGWS